MSDAGDAFTEAFREGGSAEERRQILEESEDYDTGGNGSTDNGDDRATPEAGSDRGLRNLADEAAEDSDTDSDDGGGGTFTGGSPSDFYGDGDPDANNQDGANTFDGDGDGQVNTPGGDGGGGSQPPQEPAGLQSGQVGGFEGGSFDDSEGGGIADPDTDSGGGSGPAPGFTEPPESVQTDTEGRDPANIGPADRPEPDPQQGLEEGGEFQEQAQQVEAETQRRLAEQLGRSISDRDVRITRTTRGGGPFLQSELTSTGQQAVERERFQRRFAARREAITRLDEQTEADLTAGDGIVVDGTTARLSEQGRIAEVAARTEGVSADELTTSGGEVVRVSQQTDVSPGLTRGTGSADDQTTDGFSREVARTEQLLGVDVPGDGGFLPSDPDVSEAVEERTGVDLPGRAGAEVREALGEDLPTERELLPGGDVDVSERVGEAADTAASADVPFTDIPYGQFGSRVEAADRQLSNRTAEALAQFARERGTEEAADTTAEDLLPEDRLTTAQKLGLVAGTTGAAARGASVGTRALASAELGRGALGIGAIAGGAFAVDELAIPDESERQRGELQPGEGQQAEIDTPDRPGQQRGELQPTEATVDVSEVSVPEQQTVDPGTLRVQQLLGVPEQQERPGQERQRAEETIVPREQLPEIDQPGPSVRERQRREDLTTPGRTFPTGESAVVDGTGTATEEAQQRRETAEQRGASQPAEVEAETPQSRAGVGGRQGVGQTPGQVGAQVPGVDIGQVPGLGQIQQPQFGRPVGRGTAETPATAEPTVPENRFDRPTGTGTGGPRRGSRRPPQRLPSLPDSGDDDEEERARFPTAVREVVTEFRSPLSGEVLDDA